MPLPSASVTTIPLKLEGPDPITINTRRASSAAEPETALQAPPKLATPLVPELDSNGPPGQSDPFTIDTILSFDGSYVTES